MVAGRCCQRYWPASPGDSARAAAGILIRAHWQSSAGPHRRGARLPRRAFHRHRHDFRTNPFGRKFGGCAGRCFLCDSAQADKQVGESATRFFRTDRKHCLEHAPPPGNGGQRICPVERVPLAFVRTAPKHPEQSGADPCRTGNKRTCPEGISESLCRRTGRGRGAPCCLPASIGSLRPTPGKRRVGTLSSTDRIASRCLNAASKAELATSESSLNAPVIRAGKTYR